MNRDAHTSCTTDREGRNRDASHRATRRILLGPIGAAFFLLLIVVFAAGAVALIAGSAQ